MVMSRLGLPIGRSPLEGIGSSIYRVYLAGPIDHCTPEEIHGWREKAKGILKPMRTFDPADRIFDHITGPANMKKLVEEDKIEIANSNAVLAYYNAPAAGSPMTGTTMEIPYAFGLGKMVVVVTEREFVSPWITYHSHYVVKTVEEGASIIKDFFK